MQAPRDRVLKVRLSGAEYAKLGRAFPRRGIAAGVRALALAFAQSSAKFDPGLGGPRKRVVKVRLSENEWNYVAETFPHRAVSTSLRALALGETPAHRSPALEIRRDWLLAVSRIGNNLNQIARGINHDNLTGTRIDVCRVLAKLIEIHDAIEEIYYDVQSSGRSESLDSIPVAQ
jgi:hypothetical protein